VQVWRARRAGARFFSTLPDVRIRTLCLGFVILPFCSTQSQTTPLVDYHQHMFSPAIVALASVTPPPSVDLPPDLDAVVRALGRDPQDPSLLRDLYTDDVWLVQSLDPNGIRGRDSVVAWSIRSMHTPFHLTPVGWSVGGSEGYVTAYVTEGRGESTRHVAYLLLSVRKGRDAHWRIAAEALTASPPPRLSPISASDLVAKLDAAGMRRGLVLSVAYMYGNPNRPPVENEYERVKAENDWTSQQVARYPDRLRAFCSFNPLKDYALDELERCAKDPQLRAGLKLHFGNSDVDLDNPQHVAQLRRVFRAANDLRMPVVVHLHSSVTRQRPWGREEVRIFLNEVLPSAPDIFIQIAHLGGAGGYDEPTDQAVAMFAEAIAQRDPRTRRLYFDVSGMVDPDTPVAMASLMAKRIRQLGVDRILYGTDAGSSSTLASRQGWAAFRQLPLSDADFRTIANDVTPYMR
jgi:predicted TIM-barrel fold metal-dependent hydrolase